MTTATVPLAEISHQAIQLLCREIGIANTARFLNQYSIGQENYVEDRKAIFKDQSVQEIVAEIKRQR